MRSALVRDLVNTPDRDESTELDRARFSKNFKSKIMQLLAKLGTL